MKSSTIVCEQTSKSTWKHCFFFQKVLCRVCSFQKGSASVIEGGIGILEHILVSAAGCTAWQLGDECPEENRGEAENY